MLPAARLAGRFPATRFPLRDLPDGSRLCASRCATCCAKFGARFPLRDLLHEPHCATCYMLPAARLAEGQLRKRHRVRPLSMVCRNAEKAFFQLGLSAEAVWQFASVLWGKAARTRACAFEHAGRGFHGHSGQSSAHARLRAVRACAHQLENDS